MNNAMNFIEVLIIGLTFIIIAIQWIATIRLKGSINRGSLYTSLSLLGRSWQVVLPFICILVASAAVAVRLTIKYPIDVITTLVIAIG